MPLSRSAGTLLVRLTHAAVPAMTLLPRRRFIASTCATVVGLSAWRVQAEGPQLQLVVPVPPGGSVDLTGRLLGERLPALLKQQVVVENRPGASGSLAATSVARAAGDANTLMLAFDSHATHPLVYPHLALDPRRDFTPISRLLSFPLVLAVPANFPANDLAGFLARVKREPGRYNYSSAGLGTLNHLAVELLKERTGSHLVHIPYRGGVAALQAVMTGEVHLFAGSWVAIGPHLKAGRLKVLGVTSAQRYSVAPELPTLDESGLKGFDVSTWIAAFAPAGIGAARQQQLHAAVTQALNVPEVRATLAQQGLEWVGSSPQALATFVEAEHKRWATLVQRQGLSLA